MPVPTAIHEGPTLKVITADILLGVRWYDIPKYESLQRFRELQAEYLAGLGARKAIIISVSKASGELHFESGSRDLVEAVMAAAKTHLLGMAQVVSGDGFGAASVRSVLSRTQLAVRPDFPLRIFADVNAARPWIEELLMSANRPELTRFEVLIELLAGLEEGRRSTVV